MSEQEQTQKSGLEAFKGILDYMSDSFARAYIFAEVVPANFAYDVAQSSEITEKEKAGLLQSFGEIGALMDMLKAGYDNGLGMTFLENPDNVKEFMTIISRLLALYRDFRNGIMIRPIELSLAVSDIVSDLQSFFIRFMKSINAPE
jgi:hypothetical protein